MGSDITLWALWGPISSYGIYRVKRHPMGSKPTQWGQTSSYGVRGHPMGSKVTLWGVKGHPMGSDITLWALWGPISPYGIYRIKRGSMGSKPIL